MRKKANEIKKQKANKHVNMCSRILEIILEQISEITRKKIIPAYKICIKTITLPLNPIILKAKSKLIVCVAAAKYCVTQSH